MTHSIITSPAIPAIPPLPLTMLQGKYDSHYQSTTLPVEILQLLQQTVQTVIRPSHVIPKKTYEFDVLAFLGSFGCIGCIFNFGCVACIDLNDFVGGNGCIG